MNVNDMQCGKVGEYLVCADLILRGHVAFPSEQGLPFDVVLSVNGRIYKIQVKTTRRPMPVPQRVQRTEKYLFHVRRCGKGGRTSYKTTDVDIFALVALDTRAIGYMKAVDAKQTMFFLPEGCEPLKSATGMHILSKVRNLSALTLEDCL